MSHLPTRPPNVLFIVADDHQYNALGAHGNAAVRTPHLDSLARRGIDFERAYIMGSLIPAVCSPSRACLMTGRNVIGADADPAPGGGANRQVTISKRSTLLPELFRAAGYQTFITGKWHNDVAALQKSFNCGRRIFFGGMSDHRRVPVYDYSPAGNYDHPPRVEAGFSTELFCEAATDFLRQRSNKSPFFAYVALTSPHDPRTPPDEFARMYDPGSLPLPPNFLPEHPFDNGELTIRDEQLAPKPLTPTVLQHHLANYYGMISHHDAQIGRILAALRETGVEEHTIVVYVSDHGLALGRHGLLGKQNLYEHSIRVPLLLSGPGVAPATKANGLAYSFDLFATLAHLTGLPAPNGIDSRNLVTSEGNGVSGRSSIFALYKDTQRMVADRRWKLIRYLVQGQERVQLFDLARDPDENHDISTAPDRQSVVAGLRRALETWQAAVDDRWMPTTIAAQTAVRV